MVQSQHNFIIITCAVLWYDNNYISCVWYYGNFVSSIFKELINY